MADLTDAEIIAKADGLRALIAEKACMAVLETMNPFADDPATAISILATCLGLSVRAMPNPAVATRAALTVFNGIIKGEYDK